MAIGIIFAIIGAVIFILNLIVRIDYGTVLASMFIIGGFIILSIEKCMRQFCNKSLPKEKQQEQPREDIILNDKWRCGKCSAINEIYVITCKKCGKPFNQEDNTDVNKAEN